MVNGSGARACPLRTHRIEPAGTTLTAYQRVCDLASEGDGAGVERVGVQRDSLEIFVTGQWQWPSSR